jgi:hypothetical protein
MQISAGPATDAVDLVMEQATVVVGIRAARRVAGQPPKGRLVHLDFIVAPDVLEHDLVGDQPHWHAVQISFDLRFTLRCGGRPTPQSYPRCRRRRASKILPALGWVFRGAIRREGAAPPSRTMFCRSWDLPCVPHRAPRIFARKGFMLGVISIRTPGVCSRCALAYSSYFFEPRSRHCSSASNHPPNTFEMGPDPVALYCDEFQPTGRKYHGRGPTA